MRIAVLERFPDIRRWTLLIVAVGVPVLFFRGANDPFNIPKLTLLMIGTGFAAALKGVEVSQGASWEGLKRLAFPAACIAAPLFLSWIFSPYKGWSLFGEYEHFQGLVPYIAAVAFGVLAADAFEGRAHVLLAALVLAGSIVALYGFAQTLGVDIFEWGNQQLNDPISSLGNINFTGGFLAISLPAAFGMAVFHPRRRVVLGIAFVLIAYVLYRSDSLGPLAAGLAGVVVTALALASGRFPVARLGALAAGIGAAAMVGAAVVVTTVSPTAPIGGNSATVRGYWWQAATGMVADHPIVGRGPNAFALEGPRYRSPSEALTFGSDPSDDPHSVLLSFVTAAGLIGGLGFLAALGWGIWRAFRDVGSTGGPVAAGALGATFSYLIQSLVGLDEVSLRVALWTVLAVAGAGVATAPSRKRAGSKVASSRKVRAAERRLRRPAAVAGIAVALLLWLWFSAGVLVADRNVRRGALAFQAGDLDEARDRFHRAIDRRDDAYYRRFYGFLLGDSSESEGSDVDLYAELRWTFSYLDDVPDYFGMVDYASALERGFADDPAARQEGIRVSRRALELVPRDPQLRSDLAETLNEMGRTDEALDVLRPAVELADEYDPLPDYPGSVEGHVYQTFDAVRGT